MRRFSIGKLMWLVAFLGANFAALRFLVRPGPGDWPLREMLAGLIPLADLLIISLAILASGYRVSLRRRNDRHYFALYSVLLSGVLLGAGVAACCLVPDPLVECVVTVGRPFERGLQSLGVDTVNDTPLLRYVILPGFLGVLFSGPPSILCLALSFALSRYQLVVTPRREAFGASAPSD